MYYNNEHKTFDEVKELKSRKELARICYLLDRYATEFKLEFQLAIDYLMAESGFLKSYYIPNNTEDLKLIGELTFRYVKSYNKHYTDFVKELFDCYSYCKINGYPKEASQTSLNLSFSGDTIQVGRS